MTCTSIVVATQYYSALWVWTANFGGFLFPPSKSLVDSSSSKGGHGHEKHEKTSAPKSNRGWK